MMGLRKLKKCLIKINILLLIILVSCQTNKNDDFKNGQLECVLNVFIALSPINQEEYIYISEVQYWSDTTSIISFQYSDIPPIDTQDSLTYKISNFKNFKIVHISSSFIDSYEKKYLMPTKLEWKKINVNKFDSIKEVKYLNFSEYELQIIYDFKNEKIIDILKSRPIKKENIIVKIKSCN